MLETVSYGFRLGMRRVVMRSEKPAAPNRASLAFAGTLSGPDASPCGCPQAAFHILSREHPAFFTGSSGAAKLKSEAFQSDD